MKTYLVRFTNNPAAETFYTADNPLDAIEQARADYPAGASAYVRLAAYGETDCDGVWTNGGSHACLTK